MPKAKQQKKIIVKALDSSTLSRYSSDLLYAGRFPTSLHVASASLEGISSLTTGKNQNPSPAYGTGGSSGLKDPYNNSHKNRFEDTMRADKVAQSALLKKVMFILSKKPMIVLDTYTEHPTDELRKQALESLMSRQEYRNLMDTIKKTNRKVRFHERLIGAELQKRTYGRAALGVVLQDGMPSDLKLFASKNLGQVYVDPASWKFLGVDYQDALIGTRKTFNAEELLYLTNLDFNITPNTLYYGLSEMEGIAHDSETNRIISEEDNKEIAKSNWAPKFILPLPGVNDEAIMTTLMNGLDPSKPNIVNTDVGQPVVLDTKGSGTEVNAIRELNDRRIVRGIDVPSPTMGYENVTNRATMDTVMQVYHATVLDFERFILKSQIEPQWFDSLAMKILQIDDIEEAEARVCMEFEDLVFETWADKKDVIFGLVDRGYLTPKRVLKQFGLDEAIDELDNAQQEKLAKQEATVRMQSASTQARQSTVEHQKKLSEHNEKMELMKLTKQRLELLR